MSQRKSMWRWHKLKRLACVLAEQSELDSSKRTVKHVGEETQNYTKMYSPLRKVQNPPSHNSSTYIASQPRRYPSSFKLHLHTPSLIIVCNHFPWPTNSIPFTKAVPLSMPMLAAIPRQVVSEVITITRTAASVIMPSLSMPAALLSAAFDVFYTWTLVKLSLPALASSSSWSSSKAGVASSESSSSVSPPAATVIAA